MDSFILDIEHQKQQLKNKWNKNNILKILKI